jgi:hypothetical protein
LDGKKANLEESDLGRRNTIATLLSDWGLVNLVDASQAKDKTPLRQIKIVSFRDKKEWELCQKYNIGNKK